jgi:hypothetical protein
MAKELGEYERGVKMRGRGANKALEEFMKVRITFVATNVVVSECTIVIDSIF